MKLVRTWVKSGGIGWNCVNMGEIVVKAPLRGAGWRGCGRVKLGEMGEMKVVRFDVRTRDRVRGCGEYLRLRGTGDGGGASRQDDSSGCGRV